MADAPTPDDPDVRALVALIDAQTRRLQLVLGLSNRALADLDHAVTIRETIGGMAGADLVERARDHLRTIARRGGPEDLPERRSQDQRSDPMFEQLEAKALAMLSARETYWIAEAAGLEPDRVGRLELELDLLKDDLAAALIADPATAPGAGEDRSQGLVVAGWALFAQRAENGAIYLDLVRIAGRD